MMSAALSPGAAAIVLFGTFLALFVLRVPVAFALGLACLPSLVLEPRLSPMMLFNETFKDRKSTRLNSSHVSISYAVFCLKKKNKQNHSNQHRIISLDVRCNPLVI